MKIVEFVDNALNEGIQIDTQAGVLRGVKILGEQSANGRTYTREAMKQAKGLYEGAKVNVNHGSGRSGNEPRAYQERMGVVRNVSYREGSLFADFHYNPKHALAEQLAWDAQNAPGNVGFSHVAEGKGVRKDGRTVIEAITRVESVDLVADPATTRGLFESKGNGESDLLTTTKKQIAEALSLVSEGEREQFALQLTESLGNPTGNKAMDVNEITLEHLTARPDLLGKLRESVLAEQANSEAAKKQADELKALREQVDQYKVKEAAEKKRATIDKLIVEAQLPSELATDVFVESLLDRDEQQAKALIEDRKNTFRGAARTATRPVSRSQHDAGATSRSIWESRSRN